MHAGAPRQRSDDCAVMIALVAGYTGKHTAAMHKGSGGTPFPKYGLLGENDAAASANARRARCGHDFRYSLAVIRFSYKVGHLEFFDFQ